MLNLMLAYHLTSDPELTDGVLVRIYNDDPDDKRMSRNNEFLGMQVCTMKPVYSNYFRNQQNWLIIGSRSHLSWLDLVGSFILHQYYSAYYVHV